MFADIVSVNRAPLTKNPKNTPNVVVPINKMISSPQFRNGRNGSVSKAVGLSFASTFNTFDTDNQSYWID